MRASLWLSERGFLKAFFLAWAWMPLVSCTCSDQHQAEESPEVTKNESPSEPAEPEGTAPFVPKGHVVPVGPQLVVDPGKGLSAIRFGATLETVERHMQAPCDIKTENKCVYIRQAVEFEFEDGVVKRMVAHRRDRRVADAEGSKYYGAFNGLLFPRIMLGLHRHVVIEEFGEPLKKEALEGADGQVERHFYDGLIFEYDKIENGNVVLAAIEVFPSETAKRGPQKKASDASSSSPDE